MMARLLCGTTTLQTEISVGGFGMIWVVLQFLHAGG